METLCDPHFGSPAVLGSFGESNVVEGQIAVFGALLPADLRSFQVRPDRSNSCHNSLVFKIQGRRHLSTHFLICFNRYPKLLATIHFADPRQGIRLVMAGRG